MRVEWENGDVYEGEWRNGAAHGEGTLLMSNGKYIGTLVAGKKNGEGTFEATNGDVYKGYFKNDCEDGYGESISSDGIQYKGSWKTGHMHGFGTLTTQTSDIYEGWMSMGNRHGKGRQTNNDGSTFIGLWKDNNRHGLGTLFLSNGCGYDGLWENNTPSGRGVFYGGDNSQVSKGIWMQGKLGNFTPNLEPIVKELLRVHNHWWAPLVSSQPHQHPSWIYSADDSVVADPMSPPAGSPHFSVVYPASDTMLSPSQPPYKAAALVYELLCAENDISVNSCVCNQLLPRSISTHTLTKIDLSDTYLGDVGVAVVLQLFKNCPNVTELSFQGLRLSIKSLSLLSHIASYHPRIKLINISNNFIQHSSGKQLSTMCRVNQSIEVLLLDKSKLNCGVISQIKQQLQINSRINKNRFLTHAIQ